MRKDKRKGIVWEVATNDADCRINRQEIVNGKRKIVWVCPYYRRWMNMLRRCYCRVNGAQLDKSYEGVTVCKEWLTFSNFKSWMETQDWEGKALDKDLLVKGNKVYSPKTCVFVDHVVNNFTLDNAKQRGSLPLGVSINENCIRVKCCDPFKTRSVHVGYFKDIEEAHLAWKARKHQYSVELANSEHVTDERVRQVLLTKYL